MRLFVYDMLINVNVIYYVHVCEQARWARSAGNSAIENLCFIIIIIIMYNSMYRCEETVRTLPCHSVLAERHCFRWTTITSEISFFSHPTWLCCGFYCWRKQLLSFCCCIEQIHFFWRALVAFFFFFFFFFFFLLWETTAGYWEHNYV